MRFFVPGRICLFGEHSDWAGGYRRINSDLESGYTVISGTSQGIYADVQPHPTKLILRSTLSDGSSIAPFEIDMKLEPLLEHAKSGGFFSYACGVAYEILLSYRVKGLVLDNYKTDLPIKKGLSSSAAICVMVARAFNHIYDLKMTVRGEMEFAYRGETITPSRCGRMDQGCAYGSKPIQMLFDGDRMQIEEIKVGKDLFWVIVDLNAGKDTKKILTNLNACYPFATNALQEKVQTYLGPENRKIVEQAVQALKDGDARWIGSLMKEAQDRFDASCLPVCPSELEAPILHKVLQYEPIQEFIFGGKGVGSQGDGAAQLIARDERCQRAVIEILESEQKMPCLPLVIRSGPTVRKAVIPAAGFGTRLFPATKVIKKELFPIIDATGKVKPALLIIIEQALSSGIEEVAVIIQERDKDLFESFFHKPPEIENYNKLSKDNQRYSDSLLETGKRVTFITQPVQEGFGHAVYCSRDWVGDEPFLLMLGDHVYSSGSETACIRQLVDIFERSSTNVVGLQNVAAEDIRNYGCVGGTWDISQSLLAISEFCEKPTIEYATEHLQIQDIAEGSYLCLSGLYILSTKIFEVLERNITVNAREGGEFQLTSCLDELRREEGFLGFVIEGRSHDIGEPKAYLRTLVEYSQRQIHQ